MSRDERLERQLRFDVFPNDTAKRNFHDTVVCFNCHSEVDAELWHSYKIPSDLNDFEQPFCTPSCFLNAIREYRSQDQFVFVQQYLANCLEVWVEPMETYEDDEDSDGQTPKRQKT